MAQRVSISQLCDSKHYWHHSPRESGGHWASGRLAAWGPGSCNESWTLFPWSPPPPTPPPRPGKSPCGQGWAWRCVACLRPPARSCSSPVKNEKWFPHLSDDLHCLTSLLSSILWVERPSSLGRLYMLGFFFFPLKTENKVCVLSRKFIGFLLPSNRNKALLFVISRYYVFIQINYFTISQRLESWHIVKNSMSRSAQNCGKICQYHSLDDEIKRSHSSWIVVATLLWNLILEAQIEQWSTLIFVSSFKNRYLIVLFQKIEIEKNGGSFKSVIKRIVEFHVLFH